MDRNANPADDLSALERRLSAWAPDAAGLDADAMLFAAGCAAARPGPIRFVWPSLACAMTVLAATLGVSLSSERSERQLLARRLLQQAPAPDSTPEPVFAAVPTEPPVVEAQGPSSLFAAHRALDRGLDAWPAQPMGHVSDSPSPNAPILRVGQPDALLDP